MQQPVEDKKGSQKSLSRKVSGEFNKTKQEYTIKLLKAHEKSQQSSARYLSELITGACHNSSGYGNSAGLGERKRSEKPSPANDKLKANLKGIFGSTGGLAHYQKKQFRLGRSLEGLGNSGQSHSIHLQKSKEISSTKGTSTHAQEAAPKPKPPTTNSGPGLPPTRKPKPPLPPQAGFAAQVPQGFKVQVSVEFVPGTQPTYSGPVVAAQPEAPVRQGTQRMPALPRAPISRGNVVRNTSAPQHSSKSTEHTLSRILAQALEDSVMPVEKPAEKPSGRQIIVTREDKSTLLEARYSSREIQATPCQGLLVQHENFEASHRETFMRQQHKYLQMSEKTEDLEEVSMKEKPRVSVDKRPAAPSRTTPTAACVPAQEQFRRPVGDSNPTPEVTRTEDSTCCLSSNAKNQIKWLLSDQVTKTLFEKIYRKQAAQSKLS